MYNYERKINDINKVNNRVKKDQVYTVITFRTQQLLELWENEFSGQISDGEWENSRNTNWLWRNVWLKLGDETKVEVKFSSYIGRKNFGMVKELWDVVGDRIIAENGFADEKEAKKAWREIAVAIYNAKGTEECRAFCEKLAAEKKVSDKLERESLVDEFKANVDSIDEFGRGEVGKHIVVSIGVDPARFIVTTYRCSGDSITSKSNIAPGHLKEYLDEVKKFTEAYDKLVQGFKAVTENMQLTNRV